MEEGGGGDGAKEEGVSVASIGMWCQLLHWKMRKES